MCGSARSGLFHGTLDFFRKKGQGGQKESLLCQVGVLRREMAFDGGRNRRLTGHFRPLLHPFCPSFRDSAYIEVAEWVVSVRRSTGSTTRAV